MGLSCSNASDIETVALILLERIRHTRIRLEDDTEITITVSIGCTSEPGTYQEMIRTADRAMYRAKGEGKNRVACID